jgi:hypothetical protein
MKLDIVALVCSLLGVSAWIYVHFTSRFPGRLFVGLFWALWLTRQWISLFAHHHSVTYQLWAITVALGAGMNAAVMLANGGWMPVFDKTTPAQGVWRPAEASDRLLFLADRFAGFSLGDFLILGSTLIKGLLFVFGRL